MKVNRRSELIERNVVEVEASSHFACRKNAIYKETNATKKGPGESQRGISIQV